MRGLAEYALQFVGVPYKWGGSNPISGFDCSGFVQELLASQGMDPPGDQTAQSLYEHFIKSGKSRVMGLGALAFYGKDVKSITHITMMIDDVLCIGANGGGSKTVDRVSADRDNAFIKVRPVEYRSDLVAIVMPNYN